MMTPSYATVMVQVVQDSIALVKYNRPQSGNSLHPQVVRDMLSALRWADSQESIRVIVQSGEGKFFCTGMDLTAAEDQDMDFSANSDFHELNKLLIMCEKILIAAVNGAGVGYGTSSLALFDLVYAVPNAYFFTPFVKWGMTTEGASSVSFAKIMGHQKAALLLLTGARMTAQEAERVGLISKILPEQGFLGQVIHVAKRIAQSPPGSLRTTKRLMRHTTRAELLEANDRECAVIDTERFASGEPQEAIAKFKVEQERKRRVKSKM